MNPKNKYFRSLFFQSEWKKLKYKAITFFCLALVFLFFSGYAAGVQVDISDVPLDSQLSAAAPNLMFGLDDSGSMDWEILTSETEGLFEIGNTDYTYVFDDPGDNLYTSGTYANIITGDDRRYWKSQYSGYNVMYYDPAVKYEPWQGFPNENTSKPRSHPYYNSTAPSGNLLNAVARPTPYTSDIPPANGDFLDLNATYLSMGSQTTIVIDDRDGAGVFSATGTWIESNATPEYDGGAKYTETVGDKARFTPDIPKAGNYTVDAWWNCYSVRDENAKLTIVHGNGTSSVFRNQRSTTGTCGQWVPLGAYDFTAGTSGSVSIERHAASTGDSTIVDAIRFTSMDTVIKNAHYYTWHDANNNTVMDTGEIYLVNLGGAITYYQFNDSDNDNKVESGELVKIATPPADVESTRTYADEIQNFANWYTFYRKRRATAVATISNVLPKLKGVNVGFRSINGHIISRVLPVNVGGVDNTDTLLDLLFSYHQGTHVTGSTPVRLGLENIGKYYDTVQTITPAEPELAVSPIDLGAKGECQQNFTIMFTDGAYNGNSPGLGNVDDNEGAPYADRASNTLADVAMFYWKRDLAPTVSNSVPTHIFDSASWQHMVTYTVAFGVKGNLNPDDYDLYNINTAQRVYPTWPSPINSDYERIDDLWHTAVNGRGKYLNAQNPKALIAAFESVINDVLSRIGSGSSVSINGDELHAGSVVYQSRYVTDGWTGDVLAYNLDSQTGAIIQIPLKWSGSKELDEKLTADPGYWNTGRLIATYNGSTGRPFRYANLSPVQQALLDADMVDYLRGDESKEEKKAGGIYRNRILKENGEFVRNTLLGDIVHSSPLYHNGTIYVGANDGMLHAFDADNGKELFAYVPNLVFDNLPLLTQPTYSHRFYVDLTPFAQQIGTEHLLVGGLGKGGKGYYCLDITDLDATDTDPVSITSENQLAAKVKWEYPKLGTPAVDSADMGFSFSRAVIVKSKAGWVTIFGNGYNSTNESAVLFVLDAFTGALLTKIDTNYNPSNGLSTPAPVDVDGDSIVDYVYAGDLQGNMWKFDFTSAIVSDWEVAYDPKPLFRAMDGAVSPNYQPITTKPDVTTHCSQKGYIVAFGTGKYLGSTDLADTKTQTVYGIWDYGDDADNTEYVGSFSRTTTPQFSILPNSVTLLKQTILFEGVVDTNTLRVLSEETPVWDTIADATSLQLPNPLNHVGWYLDLPTSKERIVRDLIIRDGKVIVTSAIPQANSPCVAGGESWLMELDVCTGGRINTPQVDINQDGLINDADLIQVTIDGKTVTVPPSGVWFPTIIYTPAILNIPGGDEIKYFSTAAGNIITVREKGQATGMLYWRKLL